MSRWFIFLLFLIITPGCVSGLGPFTGYGCPAPEGVKCQSIEETYRTPPDSQKKENNSQKKENNKPYYSFPLDIRSPERIQKIWVSEHITPEGDYQKGTYIYMVIKPPAWRTEEHSSLKKIPYIEEKLKDKSMPVKAEKPEEIHIPPVMEIPKVEGGVKIEE